jgi:hypothetical protein
VSGKDPSGEPTERWYPVLETSRAEIAETCRNPAHTPSLTARERRLLARRVERLPEGLIGAIADRAGQLIMEGVDYWRALALAASVVRGRRDIP